MRVDIRKAMILVEAHEGNERFPYRCTKGKLTIGVGFNLDDVGLYPEEIRFILERRLTILARQLRNEIPGWPHLSAIRQLVLIDMAYQLGINGLLGFKKMIAAIALRDYKLVYKEMLDSKWARIDTPERAQQLANMMRDDLWPVTLP